ncbi:MAG TPA: alpha/beta fold hydrolase [Chthoniobacterales bacterium]
MSEAFERRSKRNGLWRLARRLLLAFVVAIIGGVALVYFSQHSMLYHPRPYDSRYANFLPPDGVELRFETEAGKPVAFYLPRGLRRTMPKRIWVAFCGNGSLALDWTGLIAHDRQPGDAFLLLDYPGYGKSEGYATIASTRVAAESALEALAKHLGTTKEKLEPLLSVLGHSWGTAVALDFATRHSVQRIVLVAVFTNLREEAALVVGGPLSYLLSENYDNRRALAELSRRSPPPRVDIFHGTKDDIIPVRMGRELAESFPGFARFHPVNGGDHLSPLFTATDKILAAMND